MTDQPPAEPTAPPAQPPPAQQAPPTGPPPGTAPGPPPGYPPYPPYAYGPPFNTYAILALVFGVMVFPPLGIYFGIKAKEQIAQSGERGVELATAGIAIGWIFTGLYALFFLMWCGIMGSMFASIGGFWI